MTSILLPNEYFKKLDQSYQKCIVELEKELNETLWYDSALKSEIIDKFSDKYLMPKEIWDKRIDLQSLDANPNPKAEYKKIKEKALTHFYSKRKHPIYYRDPNRKLLKAKFLPAIFPLYEELQITFGETEEENDNDKFDQKYIEYCLTFPHWRLEECLKEFDEISVTPIPKPVFKKYKNVKELYNKIKLSENDLNQWFKCLLESEDDEFIIHNIEYCIGTDLTNKDLWKLYIQYLRDSKKYNEMVNVYSKYCRFFLDDFEMLNEYKSEAEKYKIENSNKKTEFTQSDSVAVKYDLQICKKSLHKNIYLQSFSLPKIFIRYILDTSNSYTLFNIYQSCKYFYHIHPKPICHKFSLQQQIMKQEITFNGQSLEVNIKKHKTQMFKNFYITNNIEFNSPKFPYSLSNLINVLYKCDAKYLNIYGQNLTLDEFKFLAGHGNIKKLIFYNVKITNPDGSLVFSEDILSITPKIYHIRMRSSFLNINSETFQILSKLKFENKFEFFFISIASGEADSNEFCEFLKKNIKKDARIMIKFQKPNQLYNSNFLKILTDNFNKVSIG